MAQGQDAGPAHVREHLAEARDQLTRRTGVPPADDAEDEELAALREAGREEQRRAIWASRVPQRFVRATLDDFGDDDANLDAVKLLRDWADQPRGRNLVVTGPLGVGKSHAAVAACRVQHDRGYEVRFYPVVELLDMLRPGGPEDALAVLCDVDRLIIDDVGSERPTEWTAERMYALVNRRWLEERPTIATSNHDPRRGQGAASPLEEALGPRTFSRLVGDGAVVVRMTGKDRRRQRR